MEIELESKLRSNLKEALGWFDFSKVYRVMNFLDWKWAGSSDTPTQYEMIEAVEELFERAVEYFKDTSSRVQSGGFSVKIWKSGNVEIEFVVESSKSHDEE